MKKFLLLSFFLMSHLHAADWVACKAGVESGIHYRGKPKDEILNDILAWAKQESDDVFTENPNYDVYSSTKAQLGPFDSFKKRKAVMMEDIRVLAGFESSWHYDADVDTANPNSVGSSCTGRETGILQTSYDAPKTVAMKTLFASSCEKYSKYKDDCQRWRKCMWGEKNFNYGYTARVLRQTVRHHGPVRDKYINKWVKKACVEEFMSKL